MVKNCSDVNNIDLITCINNIKNKISNDGESGCDANDPTTYKNCELCYDDKQKPKAVCSGFPCGDKPKCKYSGPKMDGPSDRKINLHNNCNAPIRIISTLPDDPWLASIAKGHCNNTYPGGGIIMDNGNNCKNIQQYIVPTMAPGKRESFTENLYRTKSDNYKGCGKTGQYCRPSANYRAIWGNTTKENINKAYLSQAKALEATYGGGNIGNVDTFDISGMIEGGCAAHTNLYENDLGATDDGDNCNISCIDGNCNNNNKPLQVSHKLSDLMNIINGDTSKDPKYENMHKVLEILKNDGDWKKIQTGGCFLGSEKNNSAGSKCDDKPANNKYVCGWPWIYYGNDKKKYYIKPDSNNDNKLSACEEPHMTGGKLNKSCKANKDILTKIRNELYDCSKQQSNIKRNMYDPKSTVHNYNDFIPVNLKVDKTSCGSTNDINITCNYKDYTDGNAKQANKGVCESGYAFQYDDTHSTFGCDINNNKPEYNITFCPNNTISTSCSAPPPITDKYARWINNPQEDPNNLELTCVSGYKLKTPPPPKISCTNGKWDDNFKKDASYCEKITDPKKPSKPGQKPKEPPKPDQKPGKVIKGNICYGSPPTPKKGLPPNSEWVMGTPMTTTATTTTRYLECTHSNFIKGTKITASCNIDNGKWTTPPLPRDYCIPWPILKPGQTKPDPPSDPPSDPTKHHFHKHNKESKEHKYTGEHPKYKAPDRNDELEEHYASIHGEYKTTEQLNYLITKFYEPNCSLHLNVSDDVLIKNPDMYNILAWPGESHCFGKIKDVHKEIHKHIKKKNNTNNKI